MSLFNNIPNFSWKSPANSFSELPTTVNSVGDVRITTDSNTIYTWTGNEWTQVTGGGGATTETIQLIGTVSAGDGLSITRSVSVPGILSTDTILSVTPMSTIEGTAWFYGLNGDDFGISGQIDNEISILADPAVVSNVYVVVAILRAI